VIEVTTKLTLDTDGAMKALAAGTLDGLRLAGEHILQLSRQRVPLEEGTLERSGVVTDDGNSSVAVSYDTPYAVPQHERMDYRHAAGRSAKYLELAMAEGQADAAAIVAASARRRAG
jgi:hypothetical protein